MKLISMMSDNRTWLAMGTLLLLMLATGDVLASDGANGLPYEAPLKSLVDSMTGPVAFAISVIGVIAAGAMLIFGGDMNGFMRSIVFLVLVIGLIVGSSNMLKKLFGASGAIVDAGGGVLAHLVNNGLC